MASSVLVGNENDNNSLSLNIKQLSYYKIADVLPTTKYCLRMHFVLVITPSVVSVSWNKTKCETITFIGQTYLNFRILQWKWCSKSVIFVFNGIFTNHIYVYTIFYIRRKMKSENRLSGLVFSWPLRKYRSILSGVIFSKLRFSNNT